MAIELKKK